MNKNNDNDAHEKHKTEQNKANGGDVLVDVVDKILGIRHIYYAIYLAEVFFEVLQPVELVISGINGQHVGVFEGIFAQEFFKVFAELLGKLFGGLLFGNVAKLCYALVFLYIFFFRKHLFYLQALAFGEGVVEKNLHLEILAYQSAQCACVENEQGKYAQHKKRCGDAQQHAGIRIAAEAFLGMRSVCIGHTRFCDDFWTTSKSPKGLLQR